VARVAEPIRSLILIHGAGSGPWIFAGWVHHFPDINVHAVDLQAGIEVSRASMVDYTAGVITAAGNLPPPIALCGWSMGGLVALQAAATVQPRQLILIEPSPPAEIQGYDERVEILPGTFDPEAVYGSFPPGQRSRPESSPARAERKRGISVPSLPCPALVIHGREFAEERGRAVARLYGAEEAPFPDLDHWGLVLNPRVPAAIARYLRNGSPVE
jgi:pimeloyl-ACP methyl ester carboxylesterase